MLITPTCRPARNASRSSFVIARDMQAPISRGRAAPSLPHPAQAPDQRVGRGVVTQRRLLAGEQLGRDAGGELLAELDAPLVERVPVPDRALHEHLVPVPR